MAKFFHRHSRRTEAKDAGLSDKTNFPLLSSAWVRPTESSNNATHHLLSARRLLCFGGDSRRSLTSPPEYVKADPKAASPPQDVASAWMQMGSDTTAFDSAESSSLPSSSSRSTTHARTVTIEKSSSTRNFRDRSDSKTNTLASRSQETSSSSRHSNQNSKTNTSSASNQRPRRLSATSSSSGPAPAENHRSSRSHNSSTRMKRTKNQMSASAQQSQWRSAIDPKSGRTYYYNIKTRETQWRKPMELATPQERKEMLEKERKQKDFFAAMEANILKQMATGQLPGTPTSSPNNSDVKMAEEEQQPKPSAAPRTRPTLEKPRMVRTISGMDDQILRELVKRVPSLRVSKLSSEKSMDMQELSTLHDTGHLSNISEESMGHMSNSMNMSAMEISLADLNYDVDDVDMNSPSARQEQHALRQLAKTAEEMALVSGSAKSSPVESPKAMKKNTPSSALKRPGLDKRNTCGTIYVGSTMSAPDKDATIKCVCGVYRAHILSSAKEEQRASFYFGASDSKHRVFNDREQDRIPAGTVREDVVMEDLTADESVPSLDEITNFYRDVFRRAQMETDCIVLSLVYVERLIKNTDGGLRPRPSNWRSLLFSCMILSSKVWDDLSMWNADFAQTCPSGVKFSLQRINELELAVLNALDYKVKVPASEYAKYYFLLRSMLIKSGLGGDDMSTMTPLDIEGAKKLEQVSSSFQSTAATKGRVASQDKLRSKSMGDVVDGEAADGAKGQEKKASLEQLVKM